MMHDSARLHTSVALIFTVVASAGFSGCSAGEKDASDSSRLAAVQPLPDLKTAQEAPRAVTSSANPCPHTGLWALCTVERRLKQAGFVVRAVEGASPVRSGFSLKPSVYTLGSSRLEVFIYDSEAAMSKDMSGLDTLTVTPAGTPSSWESPPVLIRNANLAAVLLTDNGRQAERVALALTAGAPQPGSPR